MSNKVLQNQFFANPVLQNLSFCFTKSKFINRFANKIPTFNYHHFLKEPKKPLAIAHNVPAFAAVAFFERRKNVRRQKKQLNANAMLCAFSIVKMSAMYSIFETGGWTEKFCFLNFSVWLPVCFCRTVR